ncbi:YceD family protein [Gilvimarinus polysaccharolyticus]|uniref:YceD family protein n=1 Tax=Gilvimarinus polysaccharolyticus TaxID=863921 RepID=UPI0006738F9D|nr:YceD family protein [Gilvimarinus polysaccharolyticus]
MSQPSFSQPLPRQGDPRKYAQQGIEISGFVDLKQLPRLATAVADKNARFAVVLSFSINEERKRVVQGSIEGEVGLTCQRCLDTVQVPLACEVNLGIIWDEDQAKTLPRDRDPWIAAEGPAEFYDLVEEELLLSLPAVAYHDRACVPHEHFESKAPESGAQEQTKQNPFQVLEQLKGTPKK